MVPMKRAEGHAVDWRDGRAARFAGRGPFLTLRRAARGTRLCDELDCLLRKLLA